MVDPELSGCAKPEGLCANLLFRPFPPKLHEIKKIRTERGGVLLTSPYRSATVYLCYISEWWKWFKGTSSALALINGAVWHKVLHSHLPLTRKTHSNHAVSNWAVCLTCCHHLFLTTIDFEANYLNSLKKRQLFFIQGTLLNRGFIWFMLSFHWDIRFLAIVVDIHFLSQIQYSIFSPVDRSF